MADRVTEYKVKLTADDEASKPIDKAAEKADAFAKGKYEAELDEHGGAEVQAAIGKILEQGTKYDSAHYEAEYKADTTQAVKSFDEVERKGGSLTGSALNALSDLTGPLGDVSQQVGGFGQAFVGAAELAGPQLEAIGVDVGKLAGVMGVGGAALGAIIYFWDTFVGGADQAQAKLLDVQKALAAGDMAKAAQGITDALQPWRSTMDDVGLSVKTATDFVTGLTDTLPLATDKVDDHRSKEFFLAQELQRQRQAWTDNHADLLQKQTDEFNVLRAIGGTTDAMLTQASTALPELQAGILRYIAVQEGIPEEKITTILTDADPDDVAQVKAELDEVAKRRTAVVDVTANTAAAEYAINSLLSDIARAQARLTIGANAMAGTPYAAGGFYRVGEAGPENVWLPRGTRVDTAGRTRMGDVNAGGAAVVNNYTINVTVPVGAPTAEVGRYVTDAIDLHERRSGRRRRAVS